MNTTDQTDLRSLLLLAATPRGRLDLRYWDGLRREVEVAGAGRTSLVVDELVREILNSIWEGGWQPAEVARAVKRAHGPDHSDLLCTAIAAFHTQIEAPPPPRWAEQLADLGAAQPWWGKGRDWMRSWALRRGVSFERTLRMVVELIGTLAWLPVIHSVVPPPSEWGANGIIASASGAVDETTLFKVRALLAKAESTNFEHEADALTAKAQELMARHAIHDAVAGHDPSRQTQRPTTRRIPVDNPYANPKSDLLHVIASANRVRSVWSPAFAFMTLVGYEADVEAVELLFTSLLMQASRAMQANGQMRDPSGRSRTRSFRHSFLLAFSRRINDRLFLAARQARQEAERELGRDLLPVLAGREEEVDDFTAQLFPHMVRSRASASATDHAGWQAGRAAAERATFGPERARLSGTGG